MYQKTQYNPKSRIFQLCYDIGRPVKAYHLNDVSKNHKDVLQPLSQLQVFYGGSNGWCIRVTKDVVDVALMIGATEFISDVYHKGGKTLMGKYYMMLTDIQQCPVVLHANGTLEQQYEINIVNNVPPKLGKWAATNPWSGKGGPAYYRVAPAPVAPPPPPS